MAAADAATVAAAAVWVEQFTQASEDLKAASTAAVESLWVSFDGWYDPVAVAKLAAEAAGMSSAAQQRTSGLSTAYASHITGTVTGRRPGSMPRKTWSVIRNGAPLAKVHTRPAQVYLRSLALGADHQEALNRAIDRAAGTMQSDITLQDRQTQQKILDQLGIVEFRRIIRPELSRTGTCGLCIAAADRRYKVGTLMPLHPPTCKCIVMPVIGDNDPGFEMNTVDTEQLYEDAGSKKAGDLRRTRYQVNTHGELGPVIGREGDNFRDASRSRLEDDPARVRRMLDAAIPVLAMLERNDDIGAPHAAERLAYQRNLIAKLQRILTAAA